MGETVSARRFPAPGWSTLVGALMALDIALLAVVALAGWAAPFLELDEGSGGTTAAGALDSAFVMLVLLAAIPALYTFDRLGTWAATREHLRLRGAWRHAGVGLGVGLGMTVASIALQLAGTRFVDLETSTGTRELIAAMTVPALIVFSIVAALGEEVFFRGLLLRRFGLHAQAFAFAAMHVQWHSAPQAVFQAGLALASAYLLGWLARRQDGLAGSVAAHFAFNASQLGLAVLTR